MKNLYVGLILTLLTFSFLCTNGGNEVTGTISETDIGVIGQIVSIDGTPVKGVEVVINTVDSIDQISPVDTTQTNDTGYYNFENLPSGKYRIEGTKEIDSLNYIALGDEFDYDSIAFSDSVYDAGIDTLMGPGAIKGVVLLEGGNHLGIEIYIPGTSFDAKSDDSGNFIMTQVPEGENYTLVFSADGYLAETKTGVSVQIEDTTKLSDTITLEYDPNQTPPAPSNLSAIYDSINSVVSLTWDSVTHPNCIGYILYRKDSTLTAAEPENVSGTMLITKNSFQDTITHLDSGDVVTFQYQLKSQSSKGNKSEYSWPYYVKVNMKKNFTYGVIGTIINPYGEPAENVKVISWLVDNPYPIEAIDTVYTNSAGIYNFKNLPNGNIIFTGEKDTDTLKWIAEMTEISDYNSDLFIDSVYNHVTDTLFETGSIAGYVKLTDTTSDLSGTVVTLITYSLKAETDSTGFYLFTSLPRGYLTKIMAEREGYDSQVLHNIGVKQNDTTFAGTIVLSIPNVDKPFILNPKNESVDNDTAITVVWKNSGDSVLYHVYLAEDTLFSDYDTTSDTSFLLTDLQNETTYYVMVAAKKDDFLIKGIYKEFTTKSSSDTSTLKAPNITYPEPNSINLDTTFTIVWDDYGSGVECFIYLSSDSSLIQSNLLDSTTSNFYVLNSLAPGTTYYCQIKAKKDNGEAYSEILKFTIKKYLPNPRMIEVKGGGLTDSYGRLASVSSFYLMEHEVTVGMYQAYNSSYINLSGGLDTNIAASSISWGDAIRYANWLSKQYDLDTCYTLIDGKKKDTFLDWWPWDTLCYEYDTSANGYRIPTGDEWQRAAQGGDNFFDYATDDGAIDTSKAWLMGDNSDGARPVKSYPANPIGFYDMTGNVWESVWDNGSAKDAGRIDFIVPADSANAESSKRGDGYLKGLSIENTFKVDKQMGGLQTGNAPFDCGFRLARSKK